MLGFGLFTLADYALFPNINEYSAELKKTYEEFLVYSYPDITQNGYGFIILQKLGEMFLYGAVIRNKYRVLCIPFFIKYAVSQTCIKLQSQAVSDYNNVDTEMLKISSIFNPDALSYLSDFGNDKKLVLIYNGVLLFSAAVIYLITQSRRLDSGE